MNYFELLTTSASPERTRVLQLILLAAATLTCAVPLSPPFAAGSEIPLQQRSTSHVEQKIPPASELREMPPQEYAKLKAGALAKAKAQVSPKIRNPKAP